MSQVLHQNDMKWPILLPMEIKKEDEGDTTSLDTSTSQTPPTAPFSSSEFDLPNSRPRGLSLLSLKIKQEEPLSSEEQKAPILVVPDSIPLSEIKVEEETKSNSQENKTSEEKVTKSSRQRFCDICGRQFATVKLLKFHSYHAHWRKRISHHSKNDIAMSLYFCVDWLQDMECPVCGEGLHQMKEVIEHVCQLHSTQSLTIHKEVMKLLEYLSSTYSKNTNQFYCHLGCSKKAGHGCTHSFPTIHSLKMHFQQFHDKFFIQVLLDRSLTSLLRMKLHQTQFEQVSTEEVKHLKRKAPMDVPRSAEPPSKNSRIPIDRREETEEGHMECSLCGFKTTILQVFNLHSTLVHGPGENGNCRVCGYRARTHELMTLHCSVVHRRPSHSDKMIMNSVYTCVEWARNSNCPFCLQDLSKMDTQEITLHIIHYHPADAGKIRDELLQLHSSLKSADADKKYTKCIFGCQKAYLAVRFLRAHLQEAHEDAFDRMLSQKGLETMLRLKVGELPTPTIPLQMVGQKGRIEKPPQVKTEKKEAPEETPPTIPLVEKIPERASAAAIVSTVAGRQTRSKTRAIFNSIVEEIVQGTCAPADATFHSCQVCAYPEKSIYMDLHMQRNHFKTCDQLFNSFLQWRGGSFYCPYCAAKSERIDHTSKHIHKFHSEKVEVVKDQTSRLDAHITIEHFNKDGKYWCNYACSRLQHGNLQEHKVHLQVMHQAAFINILNQLELSELLKLKTWHLNTSGAIGAGISVPKPYSCLLCSTVCGSENQWIAHASQCGAE